MKLGTWDLGTVFFAFVALISTTVGLAQNDPSNGPPAAPEKNIAASKDTDKKKSGDNKKRDKHPSNASTLEGTNEPNVQNVIQINEQQPQSNPHDSLYKAYLIATIAGVIGGVIGVCFLGYQTYLTRRTLVSQFRPKLTVRQMWLPYDKDKAMPQEWKIEYNVVNVGGTRARIINTERLIFWSPPNYIRAQAFKIAAFNTKVDSPEITVLSPGESVKFSIDLTGDWPECVKYWFDTRGGAIIKISGEITYADDMNAKRMLGFLREADFNSKRFHPGDDPEFEYAD